ncbi:MauE/DoxX family redox-associated membrane protein [Allokutzneria oryzae]|uniref:MauE/DoxX family redox-associated membrane protein n=1 Tax=Allokutzneria oryzae TaxID=1378989 RepID=A0ABV6A5X5_9PSEU
MFPELASAVAAAAAALLVFAGAAHTRGRTPLRSVLRVQALLPRRMWGPVAAVLGPVELLVGTTVLVTLLLAPPVFGVAAAIQGAVYSLFTIYLWILRSRRSSAPCGCFGGDEPVTWFVVTRSAVAALGSFAVTAELPLLARALCLAGGFVLAMIAWLYPMLTR